MIEQITAERFIPNHTRVRREENGIQIITGPNMGGKSTYLRQVALIVLLNQAGSFVPAAKARLGIFDRIFTRVGASDQLARGESTFMVEMHETANILNNATDRSLIILDEVGRGTATFDGLSLAWAIIEYLHDNPARSGITLFATHYHEVTDLAKTKPRVANYNVAVKEWNEQIIFLRKVVEGAADKSYGIQVAKLAGIPHSVIDRAREILETLERKERDVVEETRRRGPAADTQLGLFSSQRAGDHRRAARGGSGHAVAARRAERAVRAEAEAGVIVVVLVVDVGTFGTDANARLADSLQSTTEPASYAIDARPNDLGPLRHRPGRQTAHRPRTAHPLRDQSVRGRALRPQHRQRASSSASSWPR